MNGRADWPTCRCARPCGCARIHDFVADYRAVLATHKPRTIWEWGPGKSTEIARSMGIAVQSVEHDPRWAAKYPWAIVRELHSEAYLAFEPADLYFIDGRRRAACLRAVRDHGIVCLHDAQRVRYHPALREYAHVTFLSRGFCVAW